MNKNEFLYFYKDFFHLVILLIYCHLFISVYNEVYRKMEGNYYNLCNFVIILFDYLCRTAA